jgi:hypothetical protein
MAIKIRRDISYNGEKVEDLPDTHQRIVGEMDAVFDIVEIQLDHKTSFKEGELFNICIGYTVDGNPLVRTHVSLHADGAMNLQSVYDTNEVFLSVSALQDYLYEEQRRRDFTQEMCDAHTHAAACWEHVLSTIQTGGEPNGDDFLNGLDKTSVAQKLSYSGAVEDARSCVGDLEGGQEDNMLAVGNLIAAHCDVIRLEQPSE